MATICNHHVISCMHGLRERNLPQQQALERAGINPAVMDQPNQRVHTDQVARLFKTVQETLDDEFMGFTQNNCKVGLFATMAELVSHCSTLGELLAKAVNFYNLVSNDIPMQLSQSEGNAVQSPNADNAASVSRSSASLRAVIYVFTPFSTKPRAIIAPIPREPPVTTATLPLTSNKFFTMRLPFFLQSVRPIVKHFSPPSLSAIE